jgi:ubiquinone/menaquinone biosynthesis C-methylase UbiE
MSFTSYTPPSFIRCIFLGCLVFTVLTSCLHQPWDIDAYIKNLERPDRDEYQKPDEVLTALRITLGITVADIGAGSGYFTRRFAKAVGETGKVFAVDVEQKMLDYNRAELSKLGLMENTELILAKPDNPSLPINQIDLIFFCNVYHHLENHTAYAAKLTSALTDSGRVVIIDYYPDERSGKLEFPKHHLVPQERVIQQMDQVGFRVSQEYTFLPRQYFLEFVPAGKEQH